MQSTRDHTAEEPQPAHPEPPPLRVFEVAVTVPVLGVVVYGIAAYPGAFAHGLVFWIVLIAAIDLLPVVAWRGVEMLLDFPLLVAVAMLYRPSTACAALFIASFDTWEFKRQVSLPRAAFNRSQVAASALAASATFHALATVRDGWPEIALAGTLAIVAAYLVNTCLVAVGASLLYRESIPAVFTRLRIGRPLEFLVGNLGLGIVGIAAAELYRRVGFWGVALVIVPLVLARQSFFRALALEEAQRDLSSAYAAERKRVEELERLDRSKAEVAQVLTHDFLHAIATLRTYVTALNKNWARIDEGERVEVMGWIGRETDRLKALAEQSVATMFGYADGPALSLRPERAGDLVAEAVDATNRMDGRLQIDLPQEAARVAVLADRVRILQVFRNLLGNAAAYSNSGSPIVLCARAGEEEVRFEVRDQGPGIPPEQTEVLFRPFSRLPGPAEATQGSGLGLYISRAIVEAHQGRIGVDSEPGTGSAFWFTLRRAEA